MTPSKNADRDAREARDRLRLYNARQAVHSHQSKRRRRDNILAIVGVVIVAALATVTQVVYFSAGPGAPTAKPSTSASSSPSASATPSAAAGKNVGAVPAKTIAEDRTWSGDMTLNDVKLGITIDGKNAPQAASVFIDLAKKNFYTTTGTACFRLTKSTALSVLQCGSANGTNTGDIGYSYGPVENVPADGVYPAGTIAMASTGAAYSEGSQFFIVYATTTLPGTGYTVFGHVTSGLDNFISSIADKGILPANTGATDGAPVVPTKITQLSVQ